MQYKQEKKKKNKHLHKDQLRLADSSTPTGCLWTMGHSKSWFHHHGWALVSSLLQLCLCPWSWTHQRMQPGLSKDGTFTCRRFCSYYDNMNVVSCNNTQKEMWSLPLYPTIMYNRWNRATINEASVKIYFFNRCLVFLTPPNVKKGKQRHVRKWQKWRTRLSPAVHWLFMPSSLQEEHCHIYA